MLLTKHAERLLRTQIRQVKRSIVSKLEKEYLRSHLAFIRYAHKHCMDSAAWLVYQKAYQNHFLQMFKKWLFVEDVSEQRKLVECFPEILDVWGEWILEGLIADDTWEGQQNLIDRREVLRDARARGGTRTAIRAAYVNRYGGFILDLPPWLEQIKHKLEDLIAEKHREGTVQQRVVRTALLSQRRKKQRVQ